VSRAVLLIQITRLVLDVLVAWGSSRLPPHNSSYIDTHTDTDIYVRTQTRRHIQTHRHTQRHTDYIYTHAATQAHRHTALLITPVPSHSPHYGLIAKSHAKNEALMWRNCQTKNAAEESSTAPALEPRQDSGVRRGAGGQGRERRSWQRVTLMALS